MVYKLDDADKLCGVTYIDWSKKYSAIPKATCEMLEGQCDGLKITLACEKPKVETTDASTATETEQPATPANNSGSNNATNEI